MRVEAVEPAVRVINAYKPQWMEQALCHDYPLELFFPDVGDSRVVVNEAKRVCQRCPVAADCLAYALEFDNLPGIWGGKTQRERRKIYIAHTTPNG